MLPSLHRANAEHGETMLVARAQHPLFITELAALGPAFTSQILPTRVRKPRVTAICAGARSQGLLMKPQLPSTETKYTQGFAWAEFSVGAGSYTFVAATFEKVRVEG